MDKGLDMYNDMTKTIMKYKNTLLMSLFIYIPASQNIAMYISNLSYWAFSFILPNAANILKSKNQGQTSLTVKGWRLMLHHWFEIKNVGSRYGL